MDRDLVLTNARVITMDPAFPEADCVVIRDGRFHHVGRGEGPGRLGSGYRCVDCQGMTVVPGFVDAHFHLHAFAESLVSIDLGPRGQVRSISDMERTLAGVAGKFAPGAWIRCGGYREFHLEEKRHPTRQDLDRATSRHPIKLAHASGHAHVLNSLALEIAGISRETPDPEGGIIDRDLGTGEPTGVLYGMGEYLAAKIPPLSEEKLEEGIRRVNRELLMSGITLLQDASVRNDETRRTAVARWQAQGILRLRVVMMRGIEDLPRIGERDFASTLLGEMLRSGAVKVILRETTGSLQPDEARLKEIVLTIHRRGLQAAIHVLEERSAEAACAAIEEALRILPRSDHRHRIEHCSLCGNALAKRLAASGIAVVTQPSFIYYNGDRYLQTFPPAQLTRLYPVGMLKERGVAVAAGSDCPVVPLNPLVGVYAAVCRKTETGKVVSPEHRLAPMEALRMYTTSAATAGFMEDLAGSIREGKPADLTVLSDDPTVVAPEAIKDIRVVMTVLGGEIAWQDQAF